MFSMIYGDGVMPSAQAFWLTDTRKLVIPFRFIGKIRHFTCVKYGSSNVLELVGEIRLGAIELCAFRSVHAFVLRMVHTNCYSHEYHWPWSKTHTNKSDVTLILYVVLRFTCIHFFFFRLVLESRWWEESSRNFIIFNCLSTWNKLKQLVQIATSSLLVARSS